MYTILGRGVGKRMLKSAFLTKDDTWNIDHYCLDCKHQGGISTALAGPEEDSCRIGWVWDVGLGTVRGTGFQLVTLLGFVQVIARFVLLVTFALMSSQIVGDLSWWGEAQLHDVRELAICRRSKCVNNISVLATHIMHH
jgi:hypothetical protein